MPTQPLSKPQLPPPGPAPTITNWASLGTAFTTLYKYLAALVLYLQGYLYKIYAEIVPAQFNISPVTTTPYAVAATDEVLTVSVSGVVDLPQAVGTGRVIIVLVAAAVVVVVTPNGSDKINGAGSVTLSSEYQVLRVIDAANGTWYEW